MELRILKAILENFKGQKYLEISFGETTYIEGDNGKGKTDILDGIIWTIFGMDSKGRKVFQYKPVDEKGSEIHGLVHKVTVVLIVNGNPIEFSRAVNEKWTKQRGGTEKVFTGHMTTLTINKVPVSSEEYSNKINEIVDEKLFKLLTNVYFFTSLNDNEQREIISKLVGDVSYMDVILRNPSLGVLEEPLKNMGIAPYAKYINVEKRKCNKELGLIPPRIDECYKLVKEYDYDFLINSESELKNKLGEAREESRIYGELKERLYKEKDKLKVIEDKNSNNIQVGKEREKFSRITGEEYDVTLGIALATKEREHLKNNIKMLSESKSKGEDRIAGLREQWNEENRRVFVFPREDESCPTCNRPFDVTTLIRMRNEGQILYEGRKNKILDEINSEGVSLREKISVYDGEIKRDEEGLKACESKLDTLNTRMNEINVEKVACENKISELMVMEGDSKGRNVVLNNILELEERLKGMDFEGINSRIMELDKEYFKVCEGLNDCRRNEELLFRIGELEESGKVISRRVADYESLEILCEKFIRERASIIEERFNNKFKNIHFRLYKQQINGGITECCEVTSKGVPYSGLNTAAQVNCGLEIINALSDFYGISAPVFIDNRESVNDIVKMRGQVINFRVTRDDGIVVREVEPLRYEVCEVGAFVNKPREILSDGLGTLPEKRSLNF